MDVLSWKPATRQLQLDTSNLHIWRIDCGPGGAPLEIEWPLLSRRERAKAERLRLPHHRERYVRAHAGLRQVLSVYLEIRPERLVFKQGPAGKPSFSRRGKGLEFNMTTSGSLALVAVSLGQPVGIDCEQIRSRPGLEAIARRMFTSEESDRMETVREEERLDLFYRAWTALEARVKADGRGLSGRRQPSSLGEVQIAHCIPATGFVAAVARASLPFPSRWRCFLFGKQPTSN